MQLSFRVDICNMAALSVNSYLSKVSQAWNAGEGEMLGDLLSFRDSHIANPKLQISDPEAQVERVLDQPLDEMVAAHLRACWAWGNSDMIEAYKCQVKLWLKLEIAHPLFTLFFRVL